MVENINPTEDSAKKNTIAKVGMIFSIIGLVLTITFFGIGLGFWCLIIGLILGIIGLFSKPRGKAITAVVIPVIVFGLIILGLICIYKSNPTQEFIHWAEGVKDNPKYTTILSEIDEKDFSNRFNTKCSPIIENASSTPIKQQLESTTGKNEVEKLGYLFFDYVQQCLQETLDSYISGEPKITDTVNEEIIHSEDIEIINEENSDIEQLIESIDNEITEDLNSIEEEAHIEEVLDILSAE